MADTLEVLYCFSCQAYTIVEKIDAPPDLITECVHGHQNNLAAVRNAMRLANKTPKPQASL